VFDNLSDRLGTVFDRLPKRFQEKRAPLFRFGNATDNNPRLSGGKD
jgi:hypothetical protein